MVLLDTQKSRRPAAQVDSRSRLAEPFHRCSVAIAPPDAAASLSAALSRVTATYNAGVANAERTLSHVSIKRLLSHEQTYSRSWSSFASTRTAWIVGPPTRRLTKAGRATRWSSTTSDAGSARPTR